MRKSIRVFAVATLAAMLIGAAAAGTQPQDTGQPDSRTCRTCHPDRYGEWKSSRHADTSDAKVLKLGSGEDGIGCVSCHKPHNGAPPSEPVMDPKMLCESCHAQRAVLQGKGAKGVEETRSMHSSIACRGCHMTGGSHRMKILSPDDPGLPEDRTDSCSACHGNNSRKIRAAQIKDYRDWYRESIDPLQAEIKAIEVALEKNPDRLNPGLQSVLDGTKSNLSIIIEDGSEGVHNIDYALEIMALAGKNLAKVKASIGPTQ